MIPPFDKAGYLPPGLHPASLEEVGERYMDAVPTSSRRELFQRLRALVEQAWKVQYVKRFS